MPVVNKKNEAFSNDFRHYKALKHKIKDSSLNNHQYMVVL
jgi:hypothetical protein